MQWKSSPWRVIGTFVVYRSVLCAWGYFCALCYLLHCLMCLFIPVLNYLFFADILLKKTLSLLCPLPQPASPLQMFTATLALILVYSSHIFEIRKHGSFSVFSTSFFGIFKMNFRTSFLVLSKTCHHNFDLVSISSTDFLSSDGNFSKSLLICEQW